MNNFRDKLIDRQSHLEKAEYEHCTFLNCNLGEAKLSECKFIDCVFENCNLSLAKVYKTSFQNAQFRACKMLGFRFDTCYEFNLSFAFENCLLNHSSFHRKKIKNTIFKNSQLQEIDFTETDLSGSILDNCDLARSVFENSNLEKADFRTSFNFSIDPQSNKIKKAKFSLSGLTGLLDKYDIEIDS